MNATSVKGRVAISPSGGVPLKRLFHNHDTLILGAQLYTSIITAVGVLLLLAYLRDGTIEPAYRLMSVLCALLMWIIYKAFGVYRQSRGWRHGVGQLTKAWSTTVALVLLVGFASKTTEEYSRIAVGSWFALGFLAQLAGYLLTFRLIQKHSVYYGAPIRTIVVGSNGLARHLVQSLESNQWLPDKVVGVVDNSVAGREAWDRSLAPCLGSTHQIAELIEQHNIRRVYLALPLSNSDMIEAIYRRLADQHVDVIWAPDIFSLRLVNHGVREVAGVPLLSLSETPMSREGHLLVKTMFDYGFAALMLVAFAPLMAALAVVIKLDSPGPVFFRQLRHGWDGRIIEVWKFRSMRTDQDAPERVDQATRDDPRVTRVGRFIRRTSLDELPQLFNVLSGTMSLVGPRPHAVKHNEYYSKKIMSYMARHRLKPGLTGLAQVNGCRGETEVVEKMERRVAYDIEYINRWSFWLDLQILVKTPLSLLAKDIY